MAEVGSDDTDPGTSREARSSAASVIAELWNEREQASSTPSGPPVPTAAAYRRAPRPPRAGDDNGNAGSTVKVVLAVVVVALLLGGGAGVFLNTQGFGRTSKATFLSKADAVCGPANGTVTALAKPSSYPELATAAGTLVTATDAQLAGLRTLSAPGGTDGDKIGALLAAMTQTNDAGRSLRNAADRGDDAATAAAGNRMRTSSKDATTKAQELGFAACAAGMQPGVDTVVGGATGIVRTAFVAKADTICRGGARSLEAVRPPRNASDVSRYFGQAQPVADKIFTDLRALPVPPGDEGTVSDMMAAIESLNVKSKEARDAVLANDGSRYLAVETEMTVLGTAVNAKLDAYGLTSCGSNFGSR